MTYAVPEKFGYNAIAFDSNKVTLEQARDIATLSDPAHGRADRDLRLLPVRSSRSSPSPWARRRRISPRPTCRRSRSSSLAIRANAALVGDVVTSQTALATGQVGILLGGGEYAVAGSAGRSAEPRLGAARRGRCALAAGDRRDGGLDQEGCGDEVRSQYVLSPEGQARLATSSCYWGMPANSKATLTDEQKPASAGTNSLRFPRQILPLPFADRGDGQGDAGPLGRNRPAMRPE